METKRAAAVYPLAMTAVLAALMAVAAPFSVAIGPVPLSFCTLVIYLAGYLLGGRRAALATLAYILLGAVGMPVFSGFSAGLGVLAGPTGGYVVGYLPLAALSGLAASRFPRSRALQLLGMAGGTAVLYALGTAWYCFQSGAALAPALAACVLPFLPGDLLKMLAATAVGPVLRERLARAGIDPER